ncbi:MAG: TfoX/Sxy family protein [Chloroflexi bacterium]|nr:TfoX/Sxy family protein [Chloroflexota bacterium]
MPAKRTLTHKTPPKGSKLSPRAGPKRAMPPFEKAPAELARTFEAALHRLQAQQRKMFGCPSAFSNGNMFSFVFGHKVIVCLSPEVGARLAEGRPFEMMPGRPMKGWFVVPPSVLSPMRASIPG